MKTKENFVKNEQESHMLPVSSSAKDDVNVGNNQLQNFVDVIIKAAFSKKAENITLMDLRKVTTMTDFFVICSGESGAQLKAICSAVRIQAKEINELPWHIEEDSDPDWILMDYVNVVVHIFKPETRAYYSLERLWEDADIKECLPEDYA